MAKGYFITGTDTGVGKTVITAALAMTLRQMGKDVGVMKPVATGCVRRREGLVSEDAEFLAKAADAPESLPEVSPIRLAESLAPTVAAARAGTPIDLESVWAAWRRIRAAHPYVLVEGIGGILCPVTPEFSVADLAKRFGLPVIVVARSGLGTINHTALTVEAALRRGLEVAGVIVNRYHHETADLSEMTNPDEIARVTGVPVLGLIPDDRETRPGEGILGPDLLAAMAQLPLGELFR
jgi:dethiobiotin synthetase